MLPSKCNVWATDRDRWILVDEGTTGLEREGLGAQNGIVIITLSAILTRIINHLSAYLVKNRTPKIYRTSATYPSGTRAYLEGRPQ